MGSCVHYFQKHCSEFGVERWGFEPDSTSSCACNCGQALSLLQPWVLSHRIFVRIKAANVHKKHIVVCKMVYTCLLLLAIKFVEVNLELICIRLSQEWWWNNSLTVKTTNLYFKHIQYTWILASRLKKRRFSFKKFGHISVLSFTQLILQLGTCRVAVPGTEWWTRHSAFLHGTWDCLRKADTEQTPTSASIRWLG